MVNIIIIIFILGTPLLYFVKCHFKIKGDYLSTQQTLIYLEILQGIKTYFELFRSSLVDVNFETQESSARDAESCVLWFFVIDIRGQLNNLHINYILIG
jgi:hypothetical protein